MLKERSTEQVQVSCTIGRWLSEELSRLAQEQNTSVPQLLRDVVTEYVGSFRDHIPNAETIAAIEENDRGEGVDAKDVDELFRQCGV